MAARPEVVALLTDFDRQRTGSGQCLVHRDGTPFSTKQADLLGTANGQDLCAVSGTASSGSRTRHAHPDPRPAQVRAP